MMTLNLLGIDIWQLREEPWEDLQQKIKNCKLCALAGIRHNLVMGEGNPKAKLVLIGEAPGEQEDLKGRPFVGKAGQLLDQMLRAINLDREQIYITNILKCRPPRNRDPFPEEIKNCTPFLQKQLSLLKPKCLVALGKVAANYLLHSEAPMSKLRGNWFNYPFLNEVVPLLVLYHPAYLLRSPREKEVVYQDLLKLRLKLLQER